MIAIPITSFSNKSAIRDILESGKETDLIELRLDYIKNPHLASLIKKSSKPVIATNRKKSEGGRFTGSEKERIALLEEAVILNADYVDIEMSSGISRIKRILAFRDSRQSSSQIIVSYHNFRRTPKNLELAYKRIKRTGCDIIKIATYARFINDNLAIFNIIKKAQKDNQKIIALCMGERGEISRILGPIFGSCFTFGSLKRGKESATSQIPAKILKDIYRINKLKNKNLKIYGLAGNPVDKSRGYLLHNYLFSRFNLNSIYVNFLVDDLGPFIRSYKNLIDGLSVTMPFKERIIKFLDFLEPSAKKIGAVNTIVVRKGKLFGYNTDYLAAIQILSKKVPVLKNKKVVVLGAGGAARAVVYGLRKKGAEVTVLNRTLDKARRLAADFKCGYGHLNRIDKINFDILINATSVGMHPRVDDSPVKNKKILKNKIVFDFVYNPSTTKFLKDAKKMEGEVISGRDLFLNQAMLQFKLWTHKNIPTIATRKLIDK
jgi:3-dehydroquinate dehydratase/shikimate dehydrogenase